MRLIKKIWVCCLASLMLLPMLVSCQGSAGWT